MSPVCGSPVAHHDDAVGGLARGRPSAPRRACRPERVPERRVPAAGELAAEIAAEVAELVVADVAAELRLPLQRCLDRVEAQRHLERAHPGRPCRRRPPRPARSTASTVGSTDPTTSTAMFFPSSRLGGQGRVRALDELLGRLLAPLEVVRGRIGGVDLLLELGDPGVEPVALGVVDEAAAGDADADEDADDEHQEDRRERRDVVAEVEHAVSSLEAEHVPQRRRGEDRDAAAPPARPVRRGRAARPRSAG